MIFDKILIISDNAFLCKQFKKVIDELSIIDCSFNFATSSFSNIEDFGDIDIQVFDLKKNDDVQNILANFNLVFSIHCKQLFPSELVNGIKCINVHPGYNPINRGWYPQVFSIIHNLPIGATIHEIDEKLDHGAIIVREEVQKFCYDTSESLYNRILEKEVDLLIKYLPLILKNDYPLIRPEDDGNLFLKKDYRDLLEIDLDKNYKAGDLINKLRALTHGDFKNAYFKDKKTGKKIFIGLNLKIDE